MKKASIKMNKPIYLGSVILSLSKIKYGENIRLCYMDADSFIMHIKPENVYEDIAKDVEKKYDTSNYTVERPLPVVQWL